VLLTGACIELPSRKPLASAGQGKRLQTIKQHPLDQQAICKGGNRIRKELQLNEMACFKQHTDLFLEPRGMICYQLFL
jgi:hypothetical protein